MIKLPKAPIKGAKTDKRLVVNTRAIWSSRDGMADKLEEDRIISWTMTDIRIITKKGSRELTRAVLTEVVVDFRDSRVKSTGRVARTKAQPGLYKLIL